MAAAPTGPSHPEPDDASLDGTVPRGPSAPGDDSRAADEPVREAASAPRTDATEPDEGTAVDVEPPASTPTDEPEDDEPEDDEGDTGEDAGTDTGTGDGPAALREAPGAPGTVGSGAVDGLGEAPDDGRGRDVEQSTGHDDPGTLDEGPSDDGGGSEPQPDDGANLPERPADPAGPAGDDEESTSDGPDGGPVEPVAASPGGVAPGTGAPGDEAGAEPADDAASPDEAASADEAAATPRPAAVGRHGAGELPEPQGLRGLGRVLRPRASRSQIIVGVLCALVGFALVAQVSQTQEDQLSSLRQSDLVRLLDDVTQRSGELEDQVASLEATRDELQSGSGRARAALEVAQQQEQTQGILSGRLPAQGPGVEIEVVEGGSALDAFSLFNVLEELRNAGAEAMEVNGVRLVASSYFEDTADGVVVDGQPISSPYRWTAVGDPSTLETALEIPGGAMATLRTDGARTTVRQQDQVEVTSTREPAEPQYATPVPADG